jgi:hypothetical protein
LANFVLALFWPFFPQAFFVFNNFLALFLKKSILFSVFKAIPAIYHASTLFFNDLAAFVSPGFGFRIGGFWTLHFRLATRFFGHRMPKSRSSQTAERAFFPPQAVRRAARQKLPCRGCQILIPKPRLPARMTTSVAYHKCAGSQANSPGAYPFSCPCPAG